MADLEASGDAAAGIAEDYDPIEDELYEDDVEDARELDSEDESALALFDKGQRDLVTSVVDYNLGTLSDLIHREKIDLSPRYQRRFRWDTKRQAKLVESFLMNVPIPPIFLSEDQYGTYAVIDGKQRLFAIRRFLGGGLTLQGLEVFDEINGSSFDDLPSRRLDSETFWRHGRQSVRLSFFLSLSRRLSSRCLNASTRVEYALIRRRFGIVPTLDPSTI